MPGDEYIEAYWEDIRGYASVVEQRGEEELDREVLIGDNEENLRQCRERGLEYILIDKDYQVNWELKDSKKHKTIRRRYKCNGPD